MNELPAALPEILQSKMAKLGHTHVLTRLLGDHGLSQATPGIPHRVRCGRIFLREMRVGWRGAGCCTVSSSCTVTTSLPSAGAFFQPLSLRYDYMCEQPEFMSLHRSDERLKFFIQRKLQERESSERPSQRL